MLRPSRSFHRIAPGRIQVREGGGCLAVFGLPFLGVGLAAGLVGLGVLPLQNYGIAVRTSAPALMVIGLTFTLVGGALVFGRSWITLSSADRTIVKQVGLLVPMTASMHRVDDYTAVLIEFVRGDSDTSDSYPVSLRARAGRNLRLFSSTHYSEARERATAVAELFNFHMEDSSTGRQLSPKL
jgi:NhaP-type Na+/H+ and K+/H+ antiporter